MANLSGEFETQKFYSRYAFHLKPGKRQILTSETLAQWLIAYDLFLICQLND